MTEDIRNKCAHGAQGEELSTQNKVLNTLAGATQTFTPIKQVCAYLNAFHVYADDIKRHVEAYHYCSHLNEDLRQCIIYDSDKPDARLIGVEYMISERNFDTLDAEEQKLWHMHIGEVKTGMLIMPKPAGVPEAAWEAAENKEMEQIVRWYGKTFHFWQVDRGDKLPLGLPKLMSSYLSEDQAPPGLLDDRDLRLGVDRKRKAEVRSYMPEPPPKGDGTKDVWEGRGIRLEAKQCDSRKGGQ